MHDPLTREFRDEFQQEQLCATLDEKVVQIGRTSYSLLQLLHKHKTQVSIGHINLCLIREQCGPACSTDAEQILAREMVDDLILAYGDYVHTSSFIWKESGLKKIAVGKRKSADYQVKSAFEYVLYRLEVALGKMCTSSLTLADYVSLCITLATASSLFDRDHVSEHVEWMIGKTIRTKLVTLQTKSAKRKK